MATPPAATSSGYAYQPLGFRNDGRVGVPRFIAGDPEEVPDPSPGVMSVIWAGHFAPTPSPEDRLTQAEEGRP